MSARLQRMRVELPAVRELEDHKVRAAFLTAMEAARNRSRQLAEEAG